MVVFSKIAQLTSNPPALARSVQLLMSAQHTVTQLRLSSHRVFVRRPSTLFYNRAKDIAHFYFVGLGIIPGALLLTYINIVYGPCELHDLPENGPPVHYWQFERTPLKQWTAKYLSVSDVEGYERNLAYFEKANILSRWRKIEERVRHLESERWDYKAWFYEPVSSVWTDYGKWAADHTKAMRSVRTMG